MDYNAEFDKKLQQLNDEQRAAVNQIDGPVMVVAGPGTGKTQLLAMRVANILRMTDVLPSNILCLTFTEAAATNMVERLSTIIGADAYKVDINTFHGFGTSVINRYSEFFYNGANYQPADDLTQGEIIADILAKLPFDNQLRSINKGQFTMLHDIQRVIGSLKKAAVTPDELRQLAEQNLDFCQQIGSDINEIFNQRMSAKLINKVYDLATHARQIANSQTKLDFTDEPKLADVFAGQLESALVEATIDDKVSTKPITKFKSDWIEKKPVGDDKISILKEQNRNEKMLLVADVYQKYLAAMDERNLYDFGDMIMRVIQAVAEYPELKANLQEQYQYILVDEFQDTNDAQMRLLGELTDYDDAPNLMVVGDDDQAIYRFQGADVSNIQQFAKRFGEHLTQINLKNNYRSGADILSASQVVSSAITERLTNIDGTPKQLVAMTNPTTSLELVTASTAEQEFDYVANRVKKLIDNGEEPDSIAVIGRKHKSLEQFVPYLSHLGIKASYEHQQDVFQSQLIQLVIALAKLVNGIATGSNNDINDNLPLVMASPAFGLSRNNFYKLSLASGGRGERWMASLEANPDTAPLIVWLKEMARRSQLESLNQTLLSLIGTTETELSDNNDDDNPIAKTTAFRSPIFSYFFDIQKLQDNAFTYLSFLNDITTLLNRLKEYLPDRQLKLQDFVRFVDQCQKLNIAIYATASLGGQDNVQLMSAHKAKGLEFKTVFIIDTESEQWGSKTRNAANKLSFPANMPYDTVAGNDDDERRRLLFVAMTRAKQNLIITAHSTNEKGKELSPLEYLLEFPNKRQLPEPDIIDSIKQIETSLMDRLVQPFEDQRDLLAPKLDSYRLSATGLNTFTDVMNGGPQYFLLYNLLRVPSGTSGALIFGNAVHHTMQQMHIILNNTKQLPSIDKMLDIFHQQFDMHASDISANEAKTYRDKGDFALTEYLAKQSDHFQIGQEAERQLDAVIGNGIRLTGKLDCLEIDRHNRTIRIIDYKTGKGIRDFSERGDDYSKAKARRYLQQLIFYKLLVENSGDFQGYRVVSGSLDFVEPDRNGYFYSPETDYSDVDMDEFIQLLTSVWNHIINLDLPDISDYSVDFKGIVAFEDWLRQNP